MECGVQQNSCIQSKDYGHYIVYESFRGKYKRIHDYAHELLRSNPGSTVKVISQPYQGGEESIENPQSQLNPYFQRMYICFKACNDNFFKCSLMIR